MSLGFVHVFMQPPPTATFSWFLPGFQPYNCYNYESISWDSSNTNPSASQYWRLNPVPLHYLQVEQRDIWIVIALYHHKFQFGTLYIWYHFSFTSWKYFWLIYLIWHFSVIFLSLLSASTTLLYRLFSYWGLNSGPCMCWVNALPLSYL